MRRLLIAPVLVILLLCPFIVRASKPGQDPEPGKYMVQSEYKNDTLDYDDARKNYFKEKAAISFSKKSSFRAGYIYVDSDDDHRYTWNLALNDISNHLEVMLGNFYVSFGSGLLIGKKRFVTPDVFSSKLAASYTRPFSPCGSGNPLYSFQGLALGFSGKIYGLDLSLKGFYSIRDRYVNTDAYETGAVTGSVSSVNLRYTEENLYTTPVAIHDYGAILELMFKKVILFQVYSLHTFLRSGMHNAMPWNFNDEGMVECGIKDLTGFGFFSQYSDDYISIFVECDLLKRSILAAGPGSESGNDAGDYGTDIFYDYGLLYGIRFRHPYLGISLVGKNTGDNFYPLYGSGKNSPERSWLLTASIRPVKFFTAGASFMSEKKLAPGYQGSSLGSARREELFFRFRFRKKDRASLTLARAETGENDSVEKKYRAKSSIKMFFGKSFNAGLQGTLQHCEGSQLSGTGGIGLSWAFLHYFRINLNYSGFGVFGENRIYASISPNGNAISSGSFVGESSNVVVGKLAFKYKRNILSARYEHQFTFSRSISNKIEILGKLMF